MNPATLVRKVLADHQAAGVGFEVAYHLGMRVAELESLRDVDTIEGAVGRNREVR